MIKDFEQLPHTADLKIHVYGRTLQEFFKNAVIGMFQSIGPHAKGCEIKNERLVCPHLPEKHDVDIHSPDLDLLLVDFLSQALYLSDVYDEAYLDAIIHEVDEHHIKATLLGVKISSFDAVEIKAVTYHDLHVKKVDGIWQSDIVFDI
jgi:SHS2 domain-containing protein